MPVSSTFVASGGDGHELQMGRCCLREALRRAWLDGQTDGPRSSPASAWAVKGVASIRRDVKSVRPEWSRFTQLKLSQDSHEMVVPPVNINDVSQAIQLAIGPVFLLTGIAGMLNVMTGRLARIIDRGRQLSESELPTNPQVRVYVDAELGSLERRRHLAGAAITACTFAALLVCMVVAALFLEVILSAPLKWLVGVLFTGSTLALIVGLALFLREVHLATNTVRIPIRDFRP